ncbi:MAG: LysE family transporter [Caldilineales bacterium]|nr:LysE family transporter [Caldilineales bacterium]
MPYLLLGLSLGFSAGIAPGPLLALVIQRSLAGGLASGLRVTLAPILTDLPIIAVAVLLVGRLPPEYLDYLLIVGGLFVIWLGIDAYRHSAGAIVLTPTTSARQDLWHGALINFMNPHPYLFWAAVGAPTVVRAWRQQPAGAAAFVAGFYLTLIGSKMVIAWLFSRAQQLTTARLGRLIRASSFLLIAAGLLMLAAAWQNLRR